MAREREVNNRRLPDVLRSAELHLKAGDYYRSTVLLDCIHPTDAQVKLFNREVKREIVHLLRKGMVSNAAVAVRIFGLKEEDVKAFQEPVRKLASSPVYLEVRKIIEYAFYLRKS